MICEKCGEKLKIENAVFDGGFPVEISYCPNCLVYFELNVEGLEEG